MSSIGPILLMMLETCLKLTEKHLASAFTQHLFINMSGKGTERVGLYRKTKKAYVGLHTRNHTTKLQGVY